MTQLRTAFAGTPDFARAILAPLCASEFRPQVVLTQPDRPKGRGRALQASPVKALAQSQHIPVWQPRSLREPEAIAPLKNLDLDVLIVAAYGLILPEAVLTLPRHGCVNVHASLLPRWRGAAPIERAIMAGDDRTGVCIMQMDEGLDTGPIRLQQSLAITPEDTANSLERGLADLGVQLLLQALRNLPAEPQQQASTGACYAPKLTAADRRIDWRRSATEIALQVRALSDRMPVRCEVSGAVMQILRATVATQQDQPSTQLPGTINKCTKAGIAVQCGRDELLITELKLNRGKGLSMSAADALNGYGELLHIGTVIGAATSA